MEQILKEKNKLKKIKPIIFILLIATVIISGSTIAFFSIKESFGNKFKVKAFDISIEEPDFKGDFGSKTINIINNDSADVIIRVTINELWSRNQDDELVMLNNKVDGKDVVVKERGANWNDFIDGHDGWYYYKKVLKSDEKIELLKSIEKNTLIPEEKLKEYDSYDYELSYNYEGIQATEDAIKNIWELDANINEDGTISWNLVE